MATIQKKSFWQQYGGLILILGGIAIGALIGAFAPSVPAPEWQPDSRPSSYRCA